MTSASDTQRRTRRQRHDAILAEVADEEAEAAETEAAERRGALDVPMHLRIDKELDDYLRERAAREGIPVSALVRRLLRDAAARPSAGLSAEPSTGLSEATVESIAQRVAREELQRQ